MSYEYTPASPDNMSQARENAAQLYEHINNEAAKAIYIEHPDTRRVEIAALLAGMHILYQGPPGTGKTHTASTLTSISGGEMQLIQCTSDTVASDFTGSVFFNQGTGKFEYLRGSALNANVFFTDELNRAPAKAQAGLLELMGEGKITPVVPNGARTTYKVKEPFIVMATQNPAENSQGTVPLTKATKDRFAVGIDTPALSDEGFITVMDMSQNPHKVQTVANTEQLKEARRAVESVAFEPQFSKRVGALRSILRGEGFRDLVDLGESTLDGARVGKDTIRLAKALAVQGGRGAVNFNDITLAELYTYPHRMGVTFSALDEGATANEIVRRAQSQLPKVQIRADS